MTKSQCRPPKGRIRIRQQEKTEPRAGEQPSKQPLAPWSVEDLETLANALDIHVYISRADRLPSYAPKGDALGNWPILRVEFDGGTIIEAGGNKPEEGG